MLWNAVFNAFLKITFKTFIAKMNNENYISNEWKHVVLSIVV